MQGFGRLALQDVILLSSTARLDVVNPATEDCVATVAAAGLDDVDKALKAARAAAPGWAATPVAERQRWMLKLRGAVIANQEMLRECIHQEMGKPWGGTQEDFDLLERSLKFYAEEIQRVHDETLRDLDGTHDHRIVYELSAWRWPIWRGTSRS